MACWPNEFDFITPGGQKWNQCWKPWRWMSSILHVDSMWQKTSGEGNFPLNVKTCVLQLDTCKKSVIPLVSWRRNASCHTGTPEMHQKSFKHQGFLQLIVTCWETCKGIKPRMAWGTTKIIETWFPKTWNPQESQDSDKVWQILNVSGWIQNLGWTELEYMWRIRLVRLENEYTQHRLMKYDVQGF